MSTFNTIHIFGYGETQLIKKQYNKKIKSTELTQLQAVIDDAIAKSGKSTITPNSYHCINIFNDSKLSYMSKLGNEESFTVKFSDIDAAKLAALITEIETKIADKEQSEPQP